MYKLHTFLLCISAFFFVHAKSYAAHLSPSSPSNYERNYNYNSNSDNDCTQNLISEGQSNYDYDGLEHTRLQANSLVPNQSQNDVTQLSVDSPFKAFLVIRLTYDDQDHLHTSQTISHIFDTSGASLQIYLSSTRPGSGRPSFNDWLRAGKKGGLRRNVLAMKQRHFKNNSVVLYRGDQPGTTEIQSYVARKHGLKESQKVIDSNGINELFRLHAIDSTHPLSPFISLTTDKRVAQFFAGKKGVVNTFRIHKNRAKFNPYNKLHVPGGPKGQLIHEAEWLVPNQVLPSEFVK
ncbi:hypothetical protein LNTAR_18890 [Lentisphaera araneosa HTCC2155]|uniref:Uncharacterized protein n=1 Tax=Lentisphaera araneosa HTCC2155 TaxID=313628 RepID=A6DNT4_9BACT|nr:hypothetical protein [Lentisphaera araneosa]EDM26743.1 hypothetical protein LNTAR_18890 [Lentisphaera araneosa HTCC2155]